MFNDFVNFLQTEMPVPSAYGWFHLLSIAIVIGLSIFLGIKFKNASEKKVKIFLLITSIILILFEAYKQLVFSYSYSQDGVWDFQWYAFPFQFCSTPMYVCLIASLIKKGKVQECLYSFLATFSLFGGLLVMLVPGDVFIEFIGINIQTMVHHGAMVVIGVVLYASKSIKLQHKTILKACYVFFTLVGIALAFDCIYYWLGGTETCNLFFISPYFPSTLPVFSVLWQNLPYLLFLLSYILGFSIIAYVVLLVVMLINKCLQKKAKQNPNN